MNSIGKPAMQPPIRPSPPAVGPLSGKPVAATLWPSYPQVPPQPQQQPPGPGMSGNMRLPGIQLTHTQQQHPPAQQPLPVPPISPSAVNTTAVSSTAGASPIGPAVHTMLQAFKNQNFSQAEWLSVLRKNPQLVAQVLKLKNQKIMQQQQHQQQQQQQQQQLQQQQQPQHQMHGMPNMGQPMPQGDGQMQQQQQQQQMRSQMNQIMPQQYRQQQLQTQQQTSQFAQPQQPFVQRARMNFQQTFQNDTGHNMHQFQQQQHLMQHHQAQLKQQMGGGQPMSPQYTLAQSGNPSPQQMLQQVRSPPATAGLPQTVRSPQPTPSPRQQPILSPRQLQQSPHHNMVSGQSPLHGLGVGQDTSQMNSDHVMLPTLQTHNTMSGMSNSDLTMGQQDNEVAPLTPQDQLAHYVNQI